MTTFTVIRQSHSLNDTCLQCVHAPASQWGFSVCATSSPPEERPSKRARTTSHTNRRNASSGLFKRMQGRLSALPTMPLDVIYEILGHLLPSDLLSLSRVDRAFCDLLISRRSSFLWRASYRLIPDVPTCPKDMSEPAWAHLLFGGAYCHSCGAKPVTKILFSLRRRACKKCMRAHLLCASFLPKDVRELFCSVTVQSASSIHPARPWCTEHLWDEDVKSFQAEFNRLAPQILDSSDSANKIFSEFLERKKSMASEIKRHTQVCLAWEKERNADRSAMLSDVKAKRFEDLKARFAQIGYVEEDVAYIRWHREVSMSKPMSDRVWQRVEPLLIPEINKARDSRLQSSGDERYLGRRSLVLDHFASFMGTIPPILLAFLPSFTEFLCGYRALADAVLLENDPDDLTLNEQSREAISRLMPELESLKRERASFLRSLLPRDEAYEGAMDEDVLALAMSVYECVPCHQRSSGLHMLAHRCYGHQRSRGQYPRFSQEGKETVEVLLKLMGLGKETTALELDRRKDRFLCSQCPLSFTVEVEEGHPYSQRRLVRDWRSCVTHMCIKSHDNKTSRWLLVGERETRELYWDGDPIYGSYSCMRCPPRVDRRYGFIEWQGLETVKEHLKKEHDNDEPLEGEDFFFDFSTRRLGMTATLMRRDDAITTDTTEHDFAM
ncbi:hypothetical protein F5148DRAFT_114337 [Russula earlei]|uniref:Uncharacterized protein n=1 Tax=Russula earlei TaxID=71964 RepID=A0ACC0U6V1_9AGAM|nr:hypothetical protein F5148DRAFT_114337 [Russula earlei]